MFWSVHGVHEPNWLHLGLAHHPVPGSTPHGVVQVRKFFILSHPLLRQPNKSFFLNYNNLYVFYQQVY